MILNKLRDRKRKLILALSNSKKFQGELNLKTEISRMLDQKYSMIANFNSKCSTQSELVS